DFMERSGLVKNLKNTPNLGRESPFQPENNVYVSSSRFQNHKEFIASEKMRNHKGIKIKSQANSLSSMAGSRQASPKPKSPRKYYQTNSKSHKMLGKTIDNVKNVRSPNSSYSNKAGFSNSYDQGNKPNGDTGTLSNPVNFDVNCKTSTHKKSQSSVLNYKNLINTNLSWVDNPSKNNYSKSQENKIMRVTSKISNKIDGSETEIAPKSLQKNIHKTQSHHISNRKMDNHSAFDINRTLLHADFKYKENNSKNKYKTIYTNGMAAHVVSPNNGIKSRRSINQEIGELGSLDPPYVTASIILKNPDKQHTTTSVAGRKMVQNPVINLGTVKKGTSTYSFSDLKDKSNNVSESLNDIDNLHLQYHRNSGFTDSSCRSCNLYNRHVMILVQVLDDNISFVAYNVSKPLWNQICIAMKTILDNQKNRLNLLNLAMLHEVGLFRLSNQFEEKLLGYSSYGNERYLTWLELDWVRKLINHYDSSNRVEVGNQIPYLRTSTNFSVYELLSVFKKHPTLDQKEILSNESENKRVPNINVIKTSSRESSMESKIHKEKNNEDTLSLHLQWARELMYLDFTQPYVNTNYKDLLFSVGSRLFRAYDSRLKLLAMNNRFNLIADSWFDFYLSRLNSENTKSIKNQEDKQTSADIQKSNKNEPETQDIPPSSTKIDKNNTENIGNTVDFSKQNGLDLNHPYTEVSTSSDLKLSKQIFSKDSVHHKNISKVSVKKGLSLNTNSVDILNTDTTPASQMKKDMKSDFNINDKKNVNDIKISEINELLSNSRILHSICAAFFLTKCLQPVGYTAFSIKKHFGHITNMLKNVSDEYISYLESVGMYQIQTIEKKIDVLEAIDLLGFPKWVKKKLINGTLSLGNSFSEENSKYFDDQKYQNKNSSKNKSGDLNTDKTKNSIPKPDFEKDTDYNDYSTDPNYIQSGHGAVLGYFSSESQGRNIKNSKNRKTSGESLLDYIGPLVAYSSFLAVTTSRSFLVVSMEVNPDSILLKMSTIMRHLSKYSTSIPGYTKSHVAKNSLKQYTFELSKIKKLLHTKSFSYDIQLRIITELLKPSHKSCTCEHNSSNNLHSNSLNPSNPNQHVSNTVADNKISNKKEKEGEPKNALPDKPCDVGYDSVATKSSVGDEYRLNSNTDSTDQTDSSFFKDLSYSSSNDDSKNFSTKKEIDTLNFSYSKPEETILQNPSTPSSRLLLYNKFDFNYDKPLNPHGFLNCAEVLGIRVDLLKIFGLLSQQRYYSIRFSARRLSRMEYQLGNPLKDTTNGKLGAFKFPEGDYHNQSKVDSFERATDNSQESSQTHKFSNNVVQYMLANAHRYDFHGNSLVNSYQGVCYRSYSKSLNNMNRNTVYSTPFIHFEEASQNNNQYIKSHKKTFVVRDGFPQSQTNSISTENFKEAYLEPENYTSPRANLFPTDSNSAFNSKSDKVQSVDPMLNTGNIEEHDNNRFLTTEGLFAEVSLLALVCKCSICSCNINRDLQLKSSTNSYKERKTLIYGRSKSIKHSKSLSRMNIISELESLNSEKNHTQTISCYAILDIDPLASVLVQENFDSQLGNTSDKNDLDAISGRNINRNQFGSVSKKNIEFDPKQEHSDSNPDDYLFFNNQDRCYKCYKTNNSSSFEMIKADMRDWVIKGKEWSKNSMLVNELQNPALFDYDESLEFTLWANKMLDFSLSKALDDYMNDRMWKFVTDNLTSASIPSNQFDGTTTATNDKFFEIDPAPIISYLETSSKILPISREAKQVSDILGLENVSNSTISHLMHVHNLFFNHYTNMSSLGDNMLLENRVATCGDVDKLPKGLNNYAMKDGHFSPKLHHGNSPRKPIINKKIEGYDGIFSKTQNRSYLTLSPAITALSVQSEPLSHSRNSSISNIGNSPNTKKAKFKKADLSGENNELVYLNQEKPNDPIQVNIPNGKSTDFDEFALNALIKYNYYFGFFKQSLFQNILKKNYYHTDYSFYNPWICKEHYKKIEKLHKKNLNKLNLINDLNGDFSGQVPDMAYTKDLSFKKNYKFEQILGNTNVVYDGESKDILSSPFDDYQSSNKTDINESEATKSKISKSKNDMFVQDATQKEIKVSDTLLKSSKDIPKNKYNHDLAKGSIGHGRIDRKLSYNIESSTKQENKRNDLTKKHFSASQEYLPTKPKGNISSKMAFKPKVSIPLLPLRNDFNVSSKPELKLASSNSVSSYKNYATDILMAGEDNTQKYLTNRNISNPELDRSLFNNHFGSSKELRSTLHPQLSNPHTLEYGNSVVSDSGALL
ncbi:hypothetical protein BB559_006641, partial [Furculomyces boomerangus]